MRIPLLFVALLVIVIYSTLLAESQNVSIEDYPTITKDNFDQIQPIWSTQIESGDLGQLSTSDSLIAVTNTHQVLLFDYLGSIQGNIETSNTEAEAIAVEFTHNGDYLAIGLDNGEIYIVDTSSTHKLKYTTS